MVLSGPPKSGGVWIKLKKEKMQSDFTNKCIMNVKFPVTTLFGLIRKTQDFLLILEFYIKQIHICIYTLKTEIQQGSCCSGLGIGIFGRIRPHVYGDPLYPQCALNASTLVVYAIGPTL